LNRRLSGAKTRSGRFEKEKNLATLPGIEEKILYSSGV
jgi:hypothetical protein